MHCDVKVLAYIPFTLVLMIVSDNGCAMVTNTTNRRNDTVKMGPTQDGIPNRPTLLRY